MAFRCLARHAEAEGHVAKDVYPVAREGRRGRHNRGHALRRAANEHCGLGLRLVSDQVKSWEWESLPRREPRRARERLRPLKPRKAVAKR
jgi:hypothetical protein